MNIQHLNPVIDFFLREGVPFDTVVLLLMLPIIATFIALLRQVVGVKAFGVYTPLIVTFAFLATNGVKYGIAIFVTILLVGMLSRLLLKSLRLLYLPRVAIMLTIVAIAILFMLTIGGGLRRTGLASVSIFPILIMITLVEKFITVQIEKGDRVAFMLAAETLIISILGFYIASWPLLINFIITYPWIVILTVPLNLLIGKWTGLRITEYVRFREIIKNM
ncbi:MAG: hypothetical protein HGB08_04225 [Candidatus Moranbacteria bacterium]|nr:hypothetical protein [Candidatus Moranbacteria bacterium]